MNIIDIYNFQISSGQFLLKKWIILTVTPMNIHQMKNRIMIGIYFLQRKYCFTKCIFSDVLLDSFLNYHEEETPEPNEVISFIINYS